MLVMDLPVNTRLPVGPLRPMWIFLSKSMIEPDIIWATPSCEKRCRTCSRRVCDAMTSLPALGGDEFLGVILRHVNRPMANQVFERVRAAVAARLHELQLPVATLSAGFVMLGPDDPRIAADIFAVPPGLYNPRSERIEIAP